MTSHLSVNYFKQNYITVKKLSLPRTLIPNNENGRVCDHGNKQWLSVSLKKKKKLKGGFWGSQL